MPKIMVRGPDGKLRYVEADDHNVPVGRKDRVETGGTRKPPPRREVPEDQRVSGARERAKLTRQVMVQSNPAYGIANMIGGDYGVDLAERFGRGAIFGLDTRLGAAARASKEFITGENRNFRENYAQELEAQKKLAAEREQRTGTVGDVVEFTGGMAVPMGTGARVVQGANALRAARGAAKPLGRIAQTALAGGTVGATAGALEGAARSEDFSDVGDVAANTLRGGATGALAGAALGPAAAGLGSGVRRVARSVVGPRTARRAAAREAFEEATQQTANLINERGQSIPALERNMQELREQGIEPIVADVTKGTQGRLRGVSDLGADTKVVRQRLQERGDEAGQRIRTQIADTSGVEGDFLSAQAQREARQTRTETGATQYEVGGVMEQPVRLSREQGDIVNARVRPGTPQDRTFSEMVGRAYRNLRADPDIADTVGPGRTPTLRVLDQVMRQYREEVNGLFRAGKGTEGAALRKQWDALRGVLRQTNPQYQDILDSQARQFAEQRAMELGDQLGPSMFQNPRHVLDEWNQVGHPDDREHLRRGLVSYLFDRSGANPTQVMKAIRTATSDNAGAEGRALWERILGGEQGVRQIRRSIRREQRGAETLMRLGGSQTSGNLAELGKASVQDAVTTAGRAAVGVATGNPAMAAGGFTQTMRLLWQKVVDPLSAAERGAQAKILSRRLEPGDLQRMQEQAEQYYGRRMRRRTRTGSRGARAGATGVNYLTKPVTYYDARDDEQ